MNHRQDRRTDLREVNLTIFVPVPGSPADSHIRRGSAIVGDLRLVKERKAHIHFEGNLFGSADLARFAQRLVHAADRMVMGHPSRAQAMVPISQIIPVGVYDGLRKVTLEINDPLLLEHYTGENIVEIAGQHLPAGDSPWDIASLAAQNGGRHISTGEPPEIAGEIFYKLLSGQIARFRPDEGEARIFDADEPAIRAILDGKLSERDFLSLFGTLKVRRPRQVCA